MAKKSENPKMSKDEEIGYHKGAISTMINERNELIKIIQLIESLMQSHLKRLEELGVKIQKQESKKA
ncbi:MAG: hypothetical protein ABIE22_03785 [archaeon]